MEDLSIQKFLLKIMEIAEEDEIPCVAMADEDGTIMGVVVGEPEFIDDYIDNLAGNKSKQVH